MAAKARGELRDERHLLEKLVVYFRVGVGRAFMFYLDTIVVFLIQ